jgi:sugar fermentation stimulation protein A
MEFQAPLLSGTLIKRYKRFLADIELDHGGLITAHCPNPGAMLGICEPGSRVWVSHVSGNTRKYPHTWQLVEADCALVGVNTGWPNTLVEEAILTQTITQLQGYSLLKREVKYGANSRIDILLEGEGKPACYVEVKNVHLRRDNMALFPDCVTARGTKHLREMAHLIEQGLRAVMIYVIQRDDCERFSLAADLDRTYAQTAKQAFAQGVEAYAYACKMSPVGIELYREIPIFL